MELVTFVGLESVERVGGMTVVSGWVWLLMLGEGGL